MSIEKFGEVMHHCIATNKVKSSGGRELRLECDPADKAEIESLFQSLNITYNFITGTEFEFAHSVVHNGATAVFLDDKGYVTNAGNVADRFDQLQVVILSHKTGSLTKNVNEAFSLDKAIFWNAISYPLFIETLIGNTEFTTVHDPIQKRIIIFSDESTGPFPIGYQKQELRCGDFQNVAEITVVLQQEFKRIEFIKFFKNNVALLTKQFDEKDRMYNLVKSFQNLLTLANRDHDIYLSSFSFSNLQAEFKEARIKYFENIEKNIELVGKQIASFPLTFAASAFAGFQVKDKPMIIWAIFAAYGLYTFLAFRIIGIAVYNTDNLEADVTIEKAKMKDKYPKIAAEFSDDYEKVEKKIDKLKSLTSWLKKTLVGLLIVFAIFAAYLSFSKASPAKPTEVTIVKSLAKDTVFVHLGDSLIISTKTKQTVLKPIPSIKDGVK